MICREDMDDPNAGGGFSVSGGRDDPDPDWCRCRQGDCERRREVLDEIRRDDAFEQEIEFWAAHDAREREHDL